MSYVLKRKFHKKGYINNFFTVGTPTFEGSVVSGFSSANYLETPKFPTNVTDLEMVWKVKFSSVSAIQYFYNTAPYYSCLIGLYDSKFTFWLSNNATSWDIVSHIAGTTIISADTWYYVKFTYDGESYKLYQSTDNSTWNLEASLSSTKTIGVNYPTGRIGHGWSDSPSTNTTFDLSQSYIKINNELWWHPYKRCKYDYNFTRVGTPSISNPPSCTVSGFSSANYITKSLTFDINGDWEVVTRAYLNGLASGGPTSMLFGITKGNTFGINFYISSTAVRLAYNHTPNSSWTYTDISVSVPTDRWFYIKYVKTGTTFTFYFSEDGELFEEMGSYTYTSTLYEADGFAVGCGYSQTALPSTAIVDLTQTTIKINGKLWWSCFKTTEDVVYKEDGTLEDYDFFDYKTYALKRRFYKKGYINNFFVVGAPTITNGSVVSGFSTSNYLRLPQTPDFSTLDSWEWAFKITTGTGTSDQQLIGGLSIDRTGVEIGIISSKLKLWLGSISGSEHDISTNNAVIGTYAIATSTDYWVKLSFTGTKYILSISENGVNYTDDITIESTLRTRSENLSIGVDKYGGNRPFLGSMDLSGCYIKSNGEYLWNPYKRCKYDYNFTTVGTPSISNKEGSCEVSGFSTSAGCVIEDSFAPVSGDTWAMDFKVRTGSNVSTRQQILGGVNASIDGIEFGVDGAKWICWLGTGSSYDLASEKKGTYTVMANTDYWFRVTYDGENYTFYYSTDGVEYIQDIQVASTSIIKSGVKSIGFDKSQSSSPWLGSIDLTQSYIKINGELWWSCFKQSDDVVYDEDGTLEDYDFIDYKNCVLKAPSKNYYKYVPWEQPKLTSNTSHGNVTSTTYYSQHPPYYAFNGVIGGADKYLSESTAVDGGDITWETPEPIKIKSCEIYTTTEGGYLNRFPQTITVYGSDGGVDWVKIGSLSGYEQPASGGFVTLPCNASKAYRYTKWEFGRAFDSGSGAAVSEIVISADKVVAANYKDYDFYETIRELRKFYKNVSDYTHTATSGWSNVSNAFDGASDTYASCGTATDYIEIDFGKEVYIDSFVATGNWVDSVARAEDLRLYTVDDSDMETFVAQSSGSAGTTTYTTSASFNRVKTSKIRFRLSETDNEGNPPTTQRPTRIREININAYYETNENNYDFQKIETEKNIVYNNKTFRINPTPSNATVIINGEERNEIELMRNSAISWSVSLDGYTTQSGSLTLLEDKTLDVTLEEEPTGPLYACYYTLKGGLYSYARFPIGYDMIIYRNTNESLADSVSELNPSQESWLSLTEEEAMDGWGTTYTRYYEGDLYE